MRQPETIQDYLRGIDPDFDSTDEQSIKLVRHADGRTKEVKQTKKEKDNTKELLIHGQPFPSNIRSLLALYLYRNDLFLQYQGEQALTTYEKIKYIVSFIGEEGTSARFIGVYKVMGYTESPYNPNEVLFELHPVNSFSHLEEKIIIDWGKATTSWHQYYYNIKPVIRIEDKISKEVKLPLIDSLIDAVFSYPQLEQIVRIPEWVDKLKAVNCIYAILDNHSGKLYVGSTYNSCGILGRWESYAKNGHGDDKDLNALIAKDPLYAKNNFQWTILEVLDLNINKEQAIDRESIWKIKLGSRVHGYNNN